MQSELPPHDPYLPPDVRQERIDGREEQPSDIDYVSGLEDEDLDHVPARGRWRY